MILKRVVLLLLLIINLTSFSVAFEFNAKLITSINESYLGKPIEFNILIDTNSECLAQCSWIINSNPQKQEDIQEPLSSGYPKTIGILIIENRKGLVNYTITINCKEIQNDRACTNKEATRTLTAQTYINYPGDGLCYTSKEKCGDFPGYIKTEDCNICSSLKKQCNPVTERERDEYGCSGFCGNKIAEDYENCSTCSSDVGRCNKFPCGLNSQCESKYCLHYRCWNESYKLKDKFCDTDFGENCQNSPDDCKCKSTQECNSQGLCEDCPMNNCSIEKKQDPEGFINIREGLLLILSGRGGYSINQMIIYTQGEINDTAVCHELLPLLEDIKKDYKPENPERTITELLEVIKKCEEGILNEENKNKKEGYDRILLYLTSAFITAILLGIIINFYRKHKYKEYHKLGKNLF